MDEVKTFRVECEAKFGFRSLLFVKEVRGLNEEEVLEKVYSEIGSRNKLKRNQKEK